MCIRDSAFTDDAVIEPPSYLTKTQLEVFNFIVDALRQAKVLSRLDTQTKMCIRDSCCRVTVVVAS